jgi:hypothetical protein
MPLESVSFEILTICFYGSFAERRPAPKQRSSDSATAPPPFGDDFSNEPRTPDDPLAILRFPS